MKPAIRHDDSFLQERYNTLLDKCHLSHHQQLVGAAALQGGWQCHTPRQVTFLLLKWCPMRDLNLQQKHLINIVAIKVAVDEAPPPAKRRRSIAKIVDEKPPCPVDKPPSLPKEEII